MTFEKTILSGVSTDRTFVTSGCPSGGVNVWTAEEKKRKPTGTLTVCCC